MNTPFDIVSDDAFDRPAPPLRDVPLWSETYLWCAWDPVRRIGMYMHQGTAFFDQTVWRNTITICLPDGRMVIAKHYGRPGPAQTSGCEALGIHFDVPLKQWTVRLDGACQVVTREANRTRLATDGTPSGAQCTFVFEATKDLLNHGVVHWGKLHHNQHAWVKGHVKVAGFDLDFEGPGYRDHSRGPRDLSEYIGSDFVWMHFPKSRRTIVAADIFFRTSAYDKKYCLVNDDGEYRPARIVQMPDLVQCAPDPTQVRFRIETDRGPLDMTGTLEQVINFTHKLPGTELCLGTEWTTRSQSDMVVMDCWTTYRCGDEIAYGLCEWITPIIVPRGGPSPIPALIDIPLFRW